MMNSFRRPTLVLALCAMAGVALAQSQSSPAGTAGTGTTPPSATGTPMTTPTTPMTTPTTPMTSSGASAMSSRLPSRTDTADNAYRALDTANRGFLSKSDVQRISGFSFEAADTNHDGKLTKDEFARAWSAQSK